MSFAGRAENQRGWGGEGRPGLTGTGAEDPLSRWLANNFISFLHPEVIVLERKIDLYPHPEVSEKDFSFLFFLFFFFFMKQMCVGDLAYWILFLSGGWEREKKGQGRGWRPGLKIKGRLGCASVVECLGRSYKVQGLIPSTGKNK